MVPGRAEPWDPISLQQRHAGSIVEVYRIVEETVDQFFGLKVPTRFTELNSMFRGIDSALQVYANRVVKDLASKQDLIPPVPVLTRYSKEAGIKKVFVKKELFETRVLEREETKPREISVLTTPTLCVQLNTLYYAISHLNKLEDSIWERWTNKMLQEKLIRKPIDDKSKKDTFDGSRIVIHAAMERICEYTGTKIIFCDLRVPFIYNLYKPSVSGSRVDVLIKPLDMELGQLCDIVVEPLRDRIVTSLLQASLDGLLRVILDGGPSRVFFPGDAKLLEEDLEALMELFISGGHGFPRGVVKNQVERVRVVIKLHGYKEVKEILELLKSTWRVLGITETIHHTCYAWLLFHQYVITKKHRILLHLIEQLNKIPLMEQRGQQERLHLKSLRSGERDTSFLQAFFAPIQRWADNQLEDYHLHFSEGSAIMEKIVAVAMITRKLLLEESDNTTQSLPISDRDQIEIYITSSIKHAFTRTNQYVEIFSNVHEHHLALLGEELKKLLKKDSVTFMPVLQQRHPQATVVSASLVHKLYGVKLKPFLDSAEHLNEDVISVFPAAESLEQFIMALITSACHEENAEILLRKLNLYQLARALKLLKLNLKLPKIPNLLL